MLSRTPAPILGKIAASLHRAIAQRAVGGTAQTIAGTTVARGDGWAVSDVLCTAGPRDRAFEESHEGISVGVVVAGTFQYRSPRGRAMLVPGSLLLGNPGECYECGHEHAAGDRCVAFRFSPTLFERIAADTGARSAAAPFRAASVPTSRATARLVAGAAAGVSRATDPAWEELALELAAAAVRATGDAGSLRAPQPSRRAMARVTEIVRRIEAEPGAPHQLSRLAADAELSPYHFLRTFRLLTGVTPHQFVIRARLRAAAVRLLDGDEKVIDVALATGFGDLSNFNHAFRAEFGAAPLGFRRAARGG